MNIKTLRGFMSNVWAEYFYRYRFELESDNIDKKIVLYSVHMDGIIPWKNSKNSLPEKSKKITSIRIERIIFLTSFPPISFKSVVISCFHYSFPCYLHNFPLYIMDYHTFILHIRLVIAIQTVSSNGRSEDFLASRIFAWKFRELFLRAVYRDVCTCTVPNVPKD